MPIPYIVVDSTAAIPISTQIVGQLLLLIATGELTSGEALPPVVELAKYLGVNHNTIAAIYDHLSKSGYLFAQRGKGTFVASTQAVEKITTYKQFLSFNSWCETELSNLLRNLISLLKFLGSLSCLSIHSSASSPERESIMCLGKFHREINFLLKLTIFF
jgi:DNA-binding transcriptional regulator YhcF (GntR family)